MIALLTMIVSFEVGLVVGLRWVWVKPVTKLWKQYTS